MILLIGAFCIIVNALNKPWENDVIKNDVVSYYGYLPAVFIYDDISLKFVGDFRDKNNIFYHKYWPEEAPNGGRVIKTTMGLSFLYAPFFFLANSIVDSCNCPANGFSKTYQVILLTGTVFYLMIGFWFLRKILILFFSEKITTLTMLSVFFGTGLVWYSTTEGLMSHAYLFTLLNIFIFLIIKWHEQPKIKTAFLIGIIGGLMILIRPTMILSFLIFALYGISSKDILLEKLKLFFRKKWHIIIIAFAAVLIIIPQLIYWKNITEQWFFFSYSNEKFYFSNPHILEGLFGFRKGWLVYTPIMLFALIGLFYMKKQVSKLFFPTIILLAVVIYVLFSWWAWWYGGSFGMRSMIDFYGLLAIPMACFYTFIIDQKSKFFKRTLTGIIALLLVLNLFQTWQYNKGLIHYDAMTKEAYFKGFFQTTFTNQWAEAIEEPYYDRAKNGLPEIYSWEEIKQIKPEDVICLRAKSRMYASTDEHPENKICASKEAVWDSELYNLIWLKEKTIALKTKSGKYISLDSNNNVIAIAGDISNAEPFDLVYFNNNKIALKARNNKYVTVDDAFPFALTATANEAGKNEQFRILIN